jgi:two-component system response regulator DesR
MRSLIPTTFGRPGHLRRAIESAATGFLLKDTPARSWPAPFASRAPG